MRHLSIFPRKKTWLKLTDKKVIALGDWEQFFPWCVCVCVTTRTQVWVLSSSHNGTTIQLSLTKMCWYSSYCFHVTLLRSRVQGNFFWLLWLRPECKTPNTVFHWESRMDRAFGPHNSPLSNTDGGPEKRWPDGSCRGGWSALLSPGERRQHWAVNTCAWYNWGCKPRDGEWLTPGWGCVTSNWWPCFFMGLIISQQQMSASNK
jgi:hypothetical protein